VKDNDQPLVVISEGGEVSGNKAEGKTESADGMYKEGSVSKTGGSDIIEEPGDGTDDTLTATP
jgi:hypothetical protein